MNYKDLIDIILVLRDDVLFLWGWLITLNTALLGWLIQRRGLYGRGEKVIATVGYSIFVFMICTAMYKAYGYLDMAANELYNFHLTQGTDDAAPDMYIPADKGIIESYIKRAPAYCTQIESSECKLFSSNFHGALVWISVGFSIWFFSGVRQFGKWREMIKIKHNRQNVKRLGTRLSRYV